MDILASLYPPLSKREPLPAYYTPLCLGLSVLPFLTDHHRFAVAATLPILLYLCATWPCFTTGDPSADYYNNSHFVAVPLWYLDWVLVTPRDGVGAPAYVGLRSVAEGEEGKEENCTIASATVTNADPVHGQRWKDLTTLPQRVKWATRLMLPAHRGIGWSWQVKGVPTNTMAKLPEWQYVGWQTCWILFSYAQSVVALFILGAGCGIRARPGSDEVLRIAVSNAIIGWSGAVWVWARLSCAYSLAAALGVATGMTATWEWPPLMGSLKEAWSVRQMWSTTYHQMLSQPSKRITNWLGFRKGGLASSYGQLFVSFSISCLFHQAQMFNVTRRDMGELVFFMSQPLAIIVEDLVQWAWKTVGGGRKTSTRLQRTAGYCWTFLWFSLCLHFYVSGLVQARVMKDWLFGYAPLDAGIRVSQQMLSG